MIQVIVKTYDKTLSKYEFENKDLQEVIWRLETIETEPTEIEMTDPFQELRKAVDNLRDELIEASRINKLLDWMQKKLGRK